MFAAAAATRTALAAVSLLVLLALTVSGLAGGASAKKLDPVPPSPPANVHVTSLSSSAVAVAWDPSQDNVGVAGYYVYGDGGRSTVAGAGYTVQGADCGQSIYLAVVAFDRAGNRSSRASSTLATAACPDVTPPSTPAGFVQQATTASEVVLSWAPSADNVGVVGYGVYDKLLKIASPVQPTVTLSGLACGSSGLYQVDAVDAAGNRSSMGTAMVQTAACSDTEPPSTPTGLAISGHSATSLSFSWSSSTDNVGVSGYRLSVAGRPVATVTGLNATASGLTCDTQYAVAVDAFDAAGNRSRAATLNASTDACASPPPPPPGDTTPPSTPTGLAASGITQTGVTLSWNASTDDSGVTGYDVYRGTTKVATTTSTSTAQTGLTCSSAYAFGVAARDAAGNVSARAEINVSTTSCSSPIPPPPPPSDSTPPSQPANLGVASVTRTSVALTWAASTDNVGVTGYGTYVNGSASVVTNQPGATISGLACGTAYTFQVDAVDAAGNHSTRASVVGSTAGCADTQAPTVPANVVATSRTATSIALNWSASTDNVGVVGYGLYRGGSTTGSSSSTTGIFSGLACNTTYTLAVDAVDAEGNRSAQTVVMVSTTACADTTPPSSPTALTTSNATQTGMTLAWAASTDNVGVTGYDVYTDGIKVGSTASTSYPVINLACGKSYTLGVEAYDAMHNVSTRVTRSATTAACSQPAPPPSASLGTALPPRLAESTGATFYVSTSGSDSNSGTSTTQAWRTIGKALSTLQAGQTARVRPGNYTENLNHSNNSGTQTAPKSLVADDPANPPVISSIYIAGSTSFWRFRNIVWDTTISGAFLDDVKITASGGVAPHHLEFDGVTFRNSPGQGLLVTGAGDAIPHHLQFYNSMFRHNGFQNGQPTGYDHGAYLQNITDSVFANCIFWDNGGWGVHGYNGGSATSVRRTIFANDLAYGNVAGNGFELWQDSSGATPQTIPGDNDIVNFVSVNHTDTADGRTAYVFRNGSVAPDILNRLRNSLGYNPLTIASSGATTYTVANYLTSNPLFVNPGAGDFTPGPGSPLYAAGLAAYTPPFDFFGRARKVATIGPLIAAGE